MNKLKNKIKKFWKKYGTLKMLLSFGIAWLITNGWSYVFLGIGLSLNIGWMYKIGLGYQAFLWFPFTVEKPITFAIAVFIHKLLFNEKPKEELE